MLTAKKSATGEAALKLSTIGGGMEEIAFTVEKEDYSEAANATL